MSGQGAPSLPRRQLLIGVGLAGAGIAAPFAASARATAAIDLADQREALHALLRIKAAYPGTVRRDMIEGEVLVVTPGGTMPLCRLNAVRTTQATRVSEDHWVADCHETGAYHALGSDTVITSIKNPLTGEIIAVPAMDARYTREASVQSLPNWRQHNGFLSFEDIERSEDARIEERAALTVSFADVCDTAKPCVASDVTRVRVMPYPAWLGMQRLSGHMMVRTREYTVL